MATAEGPARRPLLGVLTLAVSLLVLASLLSSPPWPGASPAPGMPRDACGLVGVLTAQFLLDELGLPLALWGGLIGFGLGFRFLLHRPRRPWLFFLWGGPTALAVSLFFGGLTDAAVWGRGPLSISHALRSSGVLGPVGSVLVAGGLLAVLLILGVTRFVPQRLREAGQQAAETSLKAPVRLGGLFNRRERQPREPITLAGPKDDEPRWVTEKGDPAGRPSAGPSVQVAAGDGGEAALPLARSKPGAMDDRPIIGTQEAMKGSARGRKASGGRAEAAAAENERDDLRGCEGYVLPPVALLEPGEPPAPMNQTELLETSKVLVRTLRDFGIQGQVGQIHPGPVVTQYEYEPAAGVKVSQIVSRAEDLALALRASRIRLVAPIPGKAAVGVEVPNRAAACISLRSVLEEVDLGTLPGELPLVFGRDIRGRSFADRLEQMPHLLVAGTTGSGKSVFLNCALLSLLLRRTPEDLRLLLIDPKMLELTPFDGIPHLVCPVITEAKMAARMLTWAVGEMEQRYRRLAAVGVRNLEGYRSRARGPRGAAEGLEPMPHLVIVVDELADLMLTLANEIETSIARLAQMARAVGIHLVLATQRPSVDVITGVIKANFPARIAFQVASKVDSRTILDSNGAESLLGKGDMLFLPPGKAEAVRVHGAFVSERDTEAVSEFWRRQPPPPPLFRAEAIHREDGEVELGDELFEDALRLVVLQKQASVSFLQRRLKVGYSRAGRLMDLLEQAGAVGAQDGSKTREVLADERFLDQWRQREPNGVGQPLP
jgi:DNA segregation ATPase FtsK/SpoIIIE, S-DNA-T family